MRKIFCIVFFICFIFSMCACNSSSPDNTGAHETSNYNHISEFEKNYGLVSMPSGYYTRGPIKQDSNLVEQGVFKKTNNGYELKINLGVIHGLSFWENDSFYLVTGNTITEYPLSSNNPYNDSKSTILLPNDADITRIYCFNEEKIYVSARLWDEKNGRHLNENYYEVFRDGTSYKEIEYSEIP